VLWCEDTTENSRVVETKPGTPVSCRDNSRECPSRASDEGRECPSLQEVSKAENARAFDDNVREPRIPVLLRIACGREHPCRQLDGTDLVPSAPCRAVIYPGPATEWWPREAAVIGCVARGAWREARTLDAERARCGRGTLFTT